MYEGGNGITEQEGLNGMEDGISGQKKNHKKKKTLNTYEKAI